MKKIVSCLLIVLLVLEFIGAVTPLKDYVNRRAEAADISWTLIKTFGSYSDARIYSNNQLIQTMNVNNYSSTISVYPSSNPSMRWQWDYDPLMSYRVEVWTMDYSYNEVNLVGAWDDFINRSTSETVLDTITTSTPYIKVKVFQKQAVFPKYTEGTQRFTYYGKKDLVYARGNYYIPGGSKINTDLSLSQIAWGGMGSLGVDDQGRPFSAYAAALWNDGRSYVYSSTLEDSGALTAGYYNFNLEKIGDLDGVFLTKTDGAKVLYISRLAEALSATQGGFFAGTDDRTNWNSYSASPTNNTTRPLNSYAFSPATQTIKVGNRIYTSIATSGGGYAVYYEDFDPDTGSLSGLIEGTDGKFPADDLKSSYSAYSPDAIKYNGTGFSYVVVGWPAGPLGTGEGTYYEGDITYKETDSSGNVILSVPLPNKVYFPTSLVGNTYSYVEPPEYATSLNGNYATVAIPDPAGGGVKYTIIDRSNGNILKQASTYNAGAKIKRVLSARNAGDPDNAMFLICDWNSMCRVLQIPVQSSKLEIVTPMNEQMLSDLDTAFVPTVKVRDTINGNLTIKYFIDSEASPRDTKRISNTATEQLVSFNAINLSTLSEGTHTIKFAVDDGTDTVERSVSFVVDKSAPLIESFQAASSDTAISVTGAASDSPAGL
ncbi:hypothetical protein, partial [Cohnella fermenti]